MTEKAQNIQDVFLNSLRKSKIPVTMFLVKGVKLQGIVTWFDNFSVMLRRDGQSQLVYKHAISTVMPAQPIDLGIFAGLMGAKNAKNRNLQEVFLRTVQETGVPVTMFLINGVMLQGKVAAYDLSACCLNAKAWRSLPTSTLCRRCNPMLLST